MNPQVLVTFLSEMQTSIRGRLKDSLLVPTAVAVAVLAFIHGTTHGWDRYSSLWDDAGAVERTLLIAAVALGFSFLMLALDGLSPLLDRTFQSGIVGTRTLMTRQNRSEWCTRKMHETQWSDIQEALELRRTARTLNAEPSEETMPDPSWRNGMATIPVSLPDHLVPAGLKAGSIVNLHPQLGPHRVLVPGGVLVIAVSDVQATVNGATEPALRQVTVAAPPGAIADIAAITSRRLLLTVRPDPRPVPFWQPLTERTRRCIAILAGSPDDVPEPGDVLTLKSPSAGRTCDVTFCEQVDDAWIVAFHLADLPTGSVPGWLSGKDVCWTHATVTIPVAGISLGPWTAITDDVIQDESCEIRGGEVTIDGKRYRSGVLFLDAGQLENRYTTKEVAADAPFVRERVSREEAEVAILGSPLATEGQPGMFQHMRMTCGVTAQVLFNCRMLEGDMIALPNGIEPGPCLQPLYANAGALRPGDDDCVPFRWESATISTLNVPRPPTLADGDRVAVVVEDADTSGATTDVFRSTVSAPASSCNVRGHRRTVIPAIVQHPGGGEAPGTLTVLAPVGIQQPVKGIWTVRDYLAKPGAAIARVLDTTESDDALVAAHDLVTTHLVASARLSLDADSTDARVYRSHFYNHERALRDTVQYWVDTSRENWNLYFPANPNQVVATKYGNIIRTIVSYGHETYGLHTPLMLPRIIEQLDADHRKSLDAAKDRVNLLEWSVVSGLVIGIAGSWMLFRDGAPWLIPIALYVLAGIVIPWACLGGLVSAGLNYAAEAKLLMDSRRGLVLDAMGIERPRNESGEALVLQERNLWHSVGQWLEYGTDDYSVESIKVPPYTLPPGASTTDDAKEPAA